MVTTRLVLAALALALAGVPGCIHHHHHHDDGPGAEIHSGHGGGPPPHAPAHGYRRKHRDAGGVEVEVVFDTSIGVYVVLGRHDHYWDGKHYFRWNDGRWEVSMELGSRWSSASAAELPPGLAKRHRRGKGPKHKHSHPPARRAY